MTPRYDQSTKGHKPIFFNCGVSFVEVLTYCPCASETHSKGEKYFKFKVFRSEESAGESVPCVCLCALMSTHMNVCENVCISCLFKKIPEKCPGKREALEEINIKRLRMVNFLLDVWEILHCSGMFYYHPAPK